MNPETLILAATVLGLFLNAIAVLGIAWRGGNILGRLDTTMEQLSRGRTQVKEFQLTQTLDGRVPASISRMLDFADDKLITSCFFNK